MSILDATLIKDGQKVVATLDQSGEMIQSNGVLDANCIIQTANGPQKCVKTYSIGGEGGGSITVDSALSDSSTNPVQNKVITAALNDKQNLLTAGDNVTITDVNPTVIVSINSLNGQYIETNNSFSFSESNFSIEGHFKTSETFIRYGGIFCPKTATFPEVEFSNVSNTGLRYTGLLNSDTTSFDVTPSYTLLPNTEYWFRCEYDGTTQKLYFGTDKNSLSLLGSTNDSTTYADNYLVFGTLTPTWSSYTGFVGDIYISDYKVKVNGTTVFDGSDSNNYTVVGNPTITTIVGGTVISAPNVATKTELAAKLDSTTAASTYIALTQKAAANGVAGLDANAQLNPSVIPYATSSTVGGIKQSFDSSTGTWTVITE